jgi:hypothetical protein
VAFDTAQAKRSYTEGEFIKKKKSISQAIYVLDWENKKWWNKCLFLRCTTERWIYVISSDIVSNLQQDMTNFRALCWPYTNLKILEISHN